MLSAAKHLGWGRSPNSTRPFAEFILNKILQSLLQNDSEGQRVTS